MWHIFVLTWFKWIKIFSIYQFFFISLLQMETNIKRLKNLLTPQKYKKCVTKIIAMWYTLRRNYFLDYLYNVSFILILYFSHIIYKKNLLYIYIYINLLTFFFNEILPMQEIWAWKKTLNLLQYIEGPLKGSWSL